MRRIEKSRLSAPVRVVELEWTEVTDEELDVSSDCTLWCLAKHEGVPSRVAFWDVSDDASVPLRSLASDPPHRGLGYGAPGAAPRSGASTLTVCVCTRERPEELRRLLAHLGDQSDQDFDVLVIDNAPTNGATRTIVRGPAACPVRYEVEPRPGLSRARNRGLEESGSELIAWIDDDERPDRHWVRSLRAGFAHTSRPSAVVGSIFPAELETPAQVLFEKYGGFNKGRGLAPEVLRRRTSGVRSAIYPSPSLGSGGNMAYRRSDLLSIGGFDPSLGAGTLCHGGEEAAALGRLLLRGHSLLYWPAAFVWHAHRRSLDDVERQLFGYSCGFASGFLSILREEGAAALADAGLAIGLGVKDLLLPAQSVRTRGLPDDYPRRFTAAARRGLVEGAPRYVVQRWRESGLRVARTGT